MNSEQLILSTDQLGELLNLITSASPSTEEMNKAYNLIKQFSKSNTCIPVFIFHLSTNIKQGCRQLSAVLLSKKITKHWESLDDNTKENYISQLITCLSNEKSYLVLKAISLSICKLLIQNLKRNIGDEKNLSKIDNELLNFILKRPELYTSDQSQIFEINIFMLSELLDECDSEQLLPLLPKIKVILNAALISGSDKMKENATMCIGNLVRNYDLIQISELKQFIPKIFEAINKFSEETIAHIYETICDFSMKSLGFFEDSFEGIVQATYILLQNEMYQTSTKMIFAELIQMVAECKKKVFTNNNKLLLLNGIKVAYELVCEEEDNQNDNADNEISLFDIGNRLFGVFSITIKSSIYYPLIMELISNVVKNPSNTNEFQRRAAMSMFGVIASGCEDKLRDNLDDIVDILVKFFINEKSIIVQRAIIISIDNLTELFGDRMADYHDKILPMLYQGMTNSSSEKVVEACLIELNYFVRTLDFELEEYIDKFTPLLANIILTSKSYKLRSESLFALGTFINRGEEEIMNKIDYKGLITTCYNILLGKHCNTEESELRGQSLRCIGEIAVKAKLLPDEILPFSKFAIEFIQNKNEYLLVEAGFGYLGLVSSIVNFDNELEQLMSIALEIIKDDSGVHNPKKNDEYEFDSDSELDDKQINNGQNIINEDFINAKCATILAVTLFFEESAKRISKVNLPENSNLMNTTFLKYLEPLINIFEELWDNVDDNINYELVSAYKSLVISVFKIDSALGRAFWIQTVFFKFEEFLKETDDKMLVVNIFEAIYLVINDLGKDTFLNAQSQPTNILTRILDLTKLVLNKKLPCQLQNDEDEDEEEDYEEKLLQAATDIYLILAEKFGNEFHEYFTTLTETLNKCFSKKRSEYERSTIFAVYAEVLRYSKISVKFYVEYLYKQIKENIELADKNSDECFRNISYLIGVMYESDPSINFLIEKSEEYVKILQFIFENSDSFAKENVISALCRISIGMKVDIMSSIFENIYNTVFKNIPLVNDCVENEAILRFFTYFLTNVQIYSNNKEMRDKCELMFTNHIEKIVELFRYTIVNEKKCEIKEEVFNEIKILLSNLNPNEKNAMLTLMAKMNTGDLEKLKKKLS